MPLKSSAEAFNKIDHSQYPRVVVLGIVGAVFAIIYLTGLQFVSQSKASDAASFVFLLAVLPIVTAAVVAWSAGISAPNLMLGKLFVASAITTVIILALLNWMVHRATLPRHLISILPLLTGLAAILSFQTLTRAIAPTLTSAKWRRIEINLERYLIVAFLALLVLFSPYNPSKLMSSAFVSYALLTPHFIYWCVGGALFASASVWLLRHEAIYFLTIRKFANAAALIVAVLVTLALYDDSHFVDLGHYSPYIGPALQAHAGDAPMVDVYSVYGMLPWVLIWAGYSTLPATIGSAAIVVRIVTIAYYLTFVLFVYFLARRRVSAMVLMLPCLIAAIVFMPGLYAVPDMFNLNGTPSVTGMRFLPAAAMALLLSFDTKNRALRIIAFGLFVISSFWSLETFVFTSSLWIGVTVLEVIRNRNWRDTANQIAVAFGATVVAHIAFAGVVFAFYQQTVSYRSYVDLMLVFSSIKSNAIPGIGAWAILVSHDYLWWIAYWLVVFLYIAMAAIGAFRGEQRDLFGRSLGMALFAICAATYFMGRSAPTTLGFAILPFAALSILAFERLVVQGTRNTLSGQAATSFFALTITITFAFAFERFSRPVDPTFGNSTILRHCFSDLGCGPLKIASRIAAATRGDVEMPYLNMYVNEYKSNVLERISDLTALLNRFTAGQARVAILPDVEPDFFVGYVVFSKTGQWYKWPIGSVIIEQQSVVNTQRILDSSKLRNGEAFIVGKPNLLPLEKRIFDKLKSDCQLSVLTETKYNIVYRANNCADSSLDRSAP